MRYTDRETEIWDGESPLYSDIYEKYFTDLGHAEEYISDYIQSNFDLLKPEDLDTINQWLEAEKTQQGVASFAELYITKPEYLQPPNFGYIDLPEWCDELDVPEDIQEALNKVQDLVIKRKHILWYEPTKKRPTF